MTDREKLDKARLLFTGATQGDLLAREVIAIAEERAQTIACEVEHSRKLEDQLKDLHGMLAPLKDAILFARAQRRPMGIGQDLPRGAPCVCIELGTEYGRERDSVGFWVGSDDVTDADSPSPCERIALALIRLAYSVAEKVKPRP
jgi:hypothetical protein